MFDTDGSLIAIISPQTNIELEEWPTGALRVVNSRVLVDLGDWVQVYDFENNLVNEIKAEIESSDLLENGDLLVRVRQSNKITQYSDGGVLIGELDEWPYRWVKSDTDFVDADNNRYTVSSVLSESDVYYDMQAEDGSFAEWEIEHFLVVRESPCGFEQDQLNLPADKSNYQKEGDAYIHSPDKFREYGYPVISARGDVYVWERTYNGYSILKWEWVDDPSDPKGGPDAPATTSALPATGGVTLNWDASAQDPGCVDSYDVERATSADGIYELLTTVDKGTSSYGDTTATSGNTWYYRVKAKAGELESDYSPVTSATLQ